MPITKLIQAYQNIRAISSYKFLVVKMYSSENSSGHLTDRFSDKTNCGGWNRPSFWGKSHSSSVKSAQEALPSHSGLRFNQCHEFSWKRSCLLVHIARYMICPDVLLFLIGKFWLFVCLFVFRVISIRIYSEVPVAAKISYCLANNS